MLVAALLPGLVVARPAPGAAQAVHEEVEEGLDDLVHLWSAPFRADASDWAGFGGVLAATALAAAVDEPVRDGLRANPDSWAVRALGPFRVGGALEPLGRTRVLAALSGGLWLAGLVADLSDLRDAGTGCLTSNLGTTLPRHVVGSVTGRLRPETAPHPWDFEPGWAGWDRRSFPGGHAANFAACSAFWTGRFDLGAAEPVLAALAVGVGLGRVADDAHWLSDTLLGLAWGWAAGRAVADRYDDRTPEEPIGAALHLGWRFPVP